MDQAAMNGPKHITVLVVEDDAIIRLAACSVLEEMGFYVREAFDGEEGLALLREDATIAFVLSDISMPRMDGLTMLGLAREMRADLPILLTSGMSEPPPGEAFIRKPYRAAALKEMVARVLDRPDLTLAASPIASLVDTTGRSDVDHR